jgi:hypothetical protein
MHAQRCTGARSATTTEPTAHERGKADDELCSQGCGDTVVSVLDTYGSQCSCELAVDPDSRVPPKVCGERV